MKDIVRAISIRQPFVEMILRGLKTREYRSRPTNIRERVYIYASLKEHVDSAGWDAIGKEPGSLPTGRIVGTVEITGCQFSRKRDCFEYVLERPKRLRTHLVPRNQPQPGFWRPSFGGR